MSKYKNYKKEFGFSYCFGAFATYELVKYHPEKIIKVIFHVSFNKEDLEQKLISQNIAFEVDNNLIEKLANKENCYVMAIFNKYESQLSFNSSHLILVNPSNMGNLGTIIRTMLGFGVKNLAIIKPGVDYFDPKVVRASMGSIFAINIQYFDTINDYMRIHSRHELFPFMLQSSTSLANIKPTSNLIGLVFGNESSGLDDSYLKLGKPIIIKHSSDIDSLNLTNAVAIALFEFFKNQYI